MKKYIKNISTKLRTVPRPVLFISIFALIGVTALLITNAATPVTYFEAEDATITSPAQKVTDTTASNGNAIQFNAASPPPPPPTGGGFCDTFPSLPSAKPDATNTGVPAGTNLTAYTGPTTITAAGTVIDGKDITGTITISANNVTIKNSRIHPAGGENTKAITVGRGYTGAKVLYSEIFTTSGAYIAIWAPEGNATICANHIYGFKDGISVAGTNSVTIQANFIHRLRDFIGENQPDPPHYDGIEIYGGRDSYIYGNVLYDNNSSDNWWDRTSALNLTNDFDSITNVEVKGNWLGGGSFILYVRGDGGCGSSCPISGVKILNNRFVRGSSNYGNASIVNSGYTDSGNVYDDNGQAIDL